MEAPSTADLDCFVPHASLLVDKIMCVVFSAAWHDVFVSVKLCFQRPNRCKPAHKISHITRNTQRSIDYLMKEIMSLMKITKTKNNFPQ